MQKKILVVDDEPMIREILKECFEAAGFSVDEAINGREAFRMVQCHAYDCVLSDIRMPGGDGLELAQKISEMTNAKPKLFLVTGFSELSAERIREWGVLAVFDKPFDLRHVLRFIMDATYSSLKSCARINENTKF